MTLASNLRDLLRCPISGEQQEDAVVDPCGHTFEKVDVIRWLKDDRMINVASLLPIE